MVRTVSQILAESYQAHLEYREACPHMSNASGTLMSVPGDAAVAKAALSRALDLRAEATNLDPAGDDPAWLNEELHYPLLAFYAEQRIRGER